MLAWLSQNLGTVLISIGLVLIVGGILYKMWKDKKAGKSSCGGDCAHCGGCQSNAVDK